MGVVKSNGSEAYVFGVGIAFVPTKETISLQHGIVSWLGDLMAVPADEEGACTLMGACLLHAGR